MDTSLLDVTSLFMDTDELTSSSRPSTPSTFFREQSKVLPTIGGEQTAGQKRNWKNPQLSRTKDKLKKIERKKKKKNKTKEKQDRQIMQNDGPINQFTTKLPRKPIFDLAGNIITTTVPVPSVGQTNGDNVSPNPGTTKSPNEGLDKGPPLILLTTKSPESSSKSTTGSSTDDGKVEGSTLSPVINSTSKNISTTGKPSTTSKGIEDPPASTPDPESAGEDKKGRNKDRKKDKWRRRQVRRLKCPSKDFRNSPEGYKCCLKSAKCFENLPEDIEEVTDATKQNGDPQTGNFSEACGQIDDSLVCMAGVLARNQCKNAAEIVNKDLSEELVMVREFHRKHCSGTLGRTTLSPIPGGQGHSASSGSESGLPTSVVIGAAIGGFFLIILIVAIVCFARRKKSRPPTQDKVAFRNSSAESARYKEFFRSSSEVYAEIDEKHLQRSLRVNNDNTTFERVEGNGGSTGSRPLPTAPSNGVDEDRSGYLTPRDSRENINDRTGYDQLSTVSVDDVSSAGSYDKLARAHRNEHPEPEVIDGDYITPESDKPTEEKNPDNYHTYFVLEK
ncbi:uncharacterized protein LOC125653787 isoform X4 [Ostrea edulis]|uniref:uncharacterized protein LOC125653787 isoform X4 n=1 Tax=Ostrea edulis TaxID=37623 RepID=UPI0024AF90DD|nr:uncharacterized protein LOC125653787 isoform X4 [Ostrea edulis]